MKRTNVTHVKHIWKKKDLVAILLVIFIVLSIIIALVTFYGQNVGCFSIRMSDEALNQNIFLSTDPTFQTYSPRLIIESLPEVNNTTYKVINDKYVRTKVNGMYVSKSKSYIGYTFYLQNQGDEAVNITSTCEIDDCSNDAEKAIWLWYFFGEEDKGTMYQMEDDLTNVDSKWKGYDEDYIERTNFESNHTVFTRKEHNILPGEIKKITLFLWFEGEDPDCTEKIAGGMVKFNLTYSLTSEGDEA